MTENLTTSHADQEELRVLHVSLFRKAGSGHCAQLLSEAKAAEANRDVWNCLWKTELWVSRDAEASPFGRLTPLPFRHPRIAPLYLWSRLIRIHRRFDVMLLRYPMPDLFSWIMARFVPNLVTVHHTKEVEELDLQQSGLRRTVALFIEKHMQPRAFSGLCGVMAVTNEIREYELSRFKHARHSAVLPNGINATQFSPVADRRGDEINVAFIASHFYAWHGLDVLIAAAESETPRGEAMTVHLIGQLSDHQLKSIRALKGSVRFVVHGPKPRAEIEDILSHCHLALGSLAIQRKGLREACTLKVREYLASGIPVFATHRDSGLPLSFPYFRYEAEFSMSGLRRYAEKVRQVERLSVQLESEPCIDKVAIMHRAVLELRSWLKR